MNYLLWLPRENIDLHSHKSKNFENSLYSKTLEENDGALMFTLISIKTTIFKSLGKKRSILHPPNKKKT